MSSLSVPWVWYNLPKRQKAPNMVKMSLLFKQPNDETNFEFAYNQALHAIEQMPGITRRQACMVFGSPAGKSPYYRILELYFDDNQALDTALRSTEGRVAGMLVMRAAGQEVEIIFSEVFEA